MKMNILIVFPVCYNSSRIPDKPLADIHGNPMIQHVYERSRKACCTNQMVYHTGKVPYCSHGLIPYASNSACHPKYFNPLGLYGYRRNVLKKYNLLPLSDLENRARLKQLRLLQSDIPIRTSRTDPGVNTAACLERVKQLMARDYSQHKALAN
jgi:CMP-2-keto-3-deoxyoctulosonic acid synthetase